MKKWYTIGVVIAIAAIIAGLGWTMYSATLKRFVAQAAHQYEKSQTLYAKTVALDIEEYFYDIQKRLETIALLPAVVSGERNEACNSSLEAIVKANQEIFSNLGRTDSSGNFVCAVNRSIIGEQASKYGTYFKEISEDPQHRPTMSRLVSPTGSRSDVIAVHVPLFDSGGKFSGTIGGAVYFKNIEKDLLRNVKISENSFIVIHDDNGDILYHPDPLIRDKNLHAQSTLSMFTPQKVIKKYADDIARGPAAGQIRYAIREQERAGVYQPAHVIGRYWNVLVAVPIQDKENLIKAKGIHDYLALVISSFCLVLFLLSLVIVWQYTHRGERT